MFTHPLNDKRTHYMFIGYLIVKGICKFTVIRNRLGIPNSPLRRIVNTYKVKGPAGFYEENKKSTSVFLIPHMPWN